MPAPVGGSVSLQPVAETVVPGDTAQRDGHPAVPVPKAFSRMGIETPDAKVALLGTIKMNLDKITVNSHPEATTKWTVKTSDNVQ